MRRESEKLRRRHYSKPAFLKSLSFYKYVIKEVRSNHFIMSSGLPVLADIMDYIRLLLDEGCLLTVQDWCSIEIFIKDNLDLEALKGQEKKLFSEIECFIRGVES